MVQNLQDWEMFTLNVLEVQNFQNEHRLVPENAE